MGIFTILAVGAKAQHPSFERDGKWHVKLVTQDGLKNRT